MCAVARIFPPQTIYLLRLVVVLCFAAPAQAENVAPGAHWGAIDFPDRDRTVMMGYTVNRFTEFDGDRNRFNAINQTAGFNFATVSWTDRIKALPGWSANLTLGAGPTAETPSENVQNGIHRVTSQGLIPVDQTRQGSDVMAGGSLTRWSPLFSSRDTGFAGLGVAGGSLYQELYGRIGVRQLSLGELAAWLFPNLDHEALNDVSRFVRFSAMGRYSRLYGGSAYSSDVIANQSYLGQVSMSFADYSAVNGARPRWELELALTYDSGLFASPNGRWRTRRFGSVALHFPYGTIETWNDSVGSTDSGPTGGFSLMLDALTLYQRFAGQS